MQAEQENSTNEVNHKIKYTHTYNYMKKPNKKLLKTLQIKINYLYN